MPAESHTIRNTIEISHLPAPARVAVETFARLAGEICRAGHETHDFATQEEEVV